MSAPSLALQAWRANEEIAQRRAEQLRIRQRDAQSQRDRDELSWLRNPDRSGGHTPPSEIRGAWDQWGH